WSFTHLFNLKVVRVTDPAILKASMKPIEDPATLAGKLDGSGSVIAINNSGQISLLSAVYKLKGAKIQVAEKAFDAGGKHFAAGSLLISGADDKIGDTLRGLALDGTKLSPAPTVATHEATAPRIAMMHTWLATQTEGWWRY